MKRTVFLLLTATAVSFLSLAPCTAQMSSKTEKYLGILKERPTPGYLFDRFYLSWMETSTVEELEEYLKKEAETSPEIILLLAFFYEKEGMNDQALKRYEEALSKHPGSVRILYHKAGLESDTLAFTKARETLQKALSLNPGDEMNRKVQKLLGKVLVRSNEEKQALELWRKLIADHPADFDLQEDIIELQLAEGLYDEAIENCKKAVTKLAETDRYRSTKLHLRLGDIYRHAGKRKLALGTYRKIFSQVGSGSWLEKEVIAQIEHMYRIEDNLTGLRDELSAMITDMPKRVALHKRFAEVLSELGETEKADKAYLDLLKITPGDRLIREQYVQFLTRAEKFKEAQTQATALVKAHADDLELILNLAAVQHQAGNSKASAATLKTYLEKSRKTEFDYLRIAKLLQSYEFNSAATAVYRQLMEAFPESISAREELAAHLFDSGKKEQARKFYLEMAEKAEGDVLIRIIRNLHSRAFTKDAYAVIQKNDKTLANNTAFLRIAAAVAAKLEKKKEALGFARRELQLVERVSELIPAITGVIHALDKLDAEEALRKELTAMTNRSVPQTCLLAELQNRAGDEAGADKTLDIALSSDAGTALLLTEKLRLAEQRRLWEKAIDVTAALYKCRPSHRSMYAGRLADLCMRSGRSKKALEWIEQWKKVSPGSTQPYLREARIRSRAGTPDEVTRILRSACLKFPDHNGLHEQLASHYVQNGKSRDAARIYWTLLEKSNTLAARMRYVSELALLAQMDGTSEKLIQHFISRSESNPKAVFPLLALSAVYRRLGNYEMRRKYLIKATEIRTDDVSLLHEIARIESREGYTEKAIATLKKAAEKDKTTSSSERLIQEYFSNGEPEKAYRLLLKLKGGTAMDATSLEDILTSLIIHRHFKYGSELLRITRERFPDNYRIAMLKGVFLEESEQVEKAIEQYLRVLQIDKELPQRQAPQSGSVRMSRYQTYEKILPPEAARFLRAANIRYQLYQYRKPRRHRYYSPFFSRSGTIALPKSLDEVEAYVVGHLATLSMFLEEEQKKKLTERLRQHQVQYPEIKLQLTERSNLRTLPFLDEAMQSEDYSGDKTIAALWMMYRAYKGAEVDLLKKAFDLLNEDYPEVAVMCTLAAASRGGNSDAYADLLKKAVSLMKKQKQPSQFMLQSLIHFCRPGSAGISDEIREDIQKIMIRQYDRLKERKKPINGYMISGIISSLSEADDPAKLIRFLDREMAEPSSGSTGGTYSRYGYYGTHNKLAQPLHFPPQNLEGIPPVIVQCFSKDRRSHGVFYNTKLKLSTEKITPLLPSVKNKILKLLICAYCGLDEKVDAFIQELIKKEKPALNDLLLAAAWKGQQEQYAAAIRLLARARYLPMKYQQRKMVISAILAWAVRIKDMKKNEDAVQAGRQAALRMQRMRLMVEQRSQLAGIMDELGMKEEAEKLDKKIAAAASAARPTSYGGSVRMSRKTRDRLKQLFSGSKKEQERGIKLARVQFRTLTASMLSPGGGMGNSSYEIRRLVRTIRSADVWDDFIAVLKPPENSKNIRKLKLYAFALEQGKVDKEAQKVYKRVLELSPHDTTCRIRLAILLVKEEQLEEAEKQIQAAAKKFPQHVFTNLLQAMRGQNGVKGKLIYIPLFKALISHTGKKKRNAAIPYMHLLNCFGNFNYESGRRLPYIFDPRAAEKKKKLSDATQKVVEERNKSFLEVCDLLMKIPVYRNFAFSRKIAFLKSAGASTEAMVPVAEKCLLSTDRASLMTAGFPSTTSYNNIQVYFQQPAEFLAHHYLTTGHADKLDALTAKMTKGYHHRSKETIRSLKKLFQAEKGTLAKVAEAYLSKQPNVYGAGFYGNTSMHIIQAWKHRGTNEDLSPLFLKQAKGITGMGYFQSNAFVQWAGALGEEKRWEEQKKFIDDFTLAVLGKQLVHKSTTPIHRNTPAYQKVSSYLQFLKALSRRPETALAAVEQITTVSCLKDFGNNYDVESILRNIRPHFKDEKFLLSLPVMGPLTEFRSFEMEHRNKGVARSVVKELSANSSLKEKISKIDPLPFGAGLMLALVKSKSRAIEYMGKHLEQIRKLPRERQAAVFSAIRYGRPATVILPGEAKKLSETGQAAYNVYKAYLQEKRHAKTETILDRKLTNSNLYQYAEEVTEICKGLLASDAARAEEIFTKAAEKITTAMRRSGGGTYNGRPDTGERRILDKMEDDVNDLRETAFVCSMALKTRTAHIYSNVSNELKSLLRKEFNRHLSDMKKPAKKKTSAGKKENTAADVQKPVLSLRAQAFKATIEEMAKQFGKVYPPCLLSPVRSLCYEAGFRKKEKMTPIVPWLKERMSGSTPCEREAALVALNMYHNLNTSTNEKKPMPELSGYYYKIVTNSELPVSYRVHVGSHVSSYRYDWALPMITRITVPTVELVASNTRKLGVNTYRLRELLKLLTLAPVTDAWKAAAQKGIRQLTKELKRNRRSGQSRSGLAVLSVSLKLNDDSSRIEELFNTPSLGLKQNKAAYGLLLEHGHTEKMIQLFTKYWASMNLTRDSVSEIYTLSDEKRAEAEKAVRKIKPAGLAYYARVMMAAIPDRPENPRPWSSASLSPDRLNTIAGEFASVKFTDEKQRERCVDVLASVKTADKLSDAILARYADENPVLFALLENPEREIRVRGYAVYMRLLLDRGEKKKFDETCEALSTHLSGDSSYKYRKIYNDFIDVFADRALNLYAKDKPAEVCDLAQKLVGFVPKLRYKHADLVGVALVLTYLTAPPEKATEWGRGLGKKRRIKRRLRLNNLLKFFDNAVEKNVLPPDKVLARLKAFLDDPLTAEVTRYYDIGKKEETMEKFRKKHADYLKKTDVGKSAEPETKQ